MNAKELRDALAKLGFKLSTPALSSIVLRYANKKGQVSEDDFLQVCCRVKSTFGNFQYFMSAVKVRCNCRSGYLESVKSNPSVELPPLVLILNWVALICPWVGCLGALSNF